MYKHNWNKADRISNAVLILGYSAFYLQLWATIVTIPFSFFLGMKSCKIFQNYTQNAANLWGENGKNKSDEQTGD